MTQVTRQPRTLASGVSQAIQLPVWQEMQTTSRTGSELQRSMPRLTGNMQMRFRARRIGFSTVRVDFPGADYWFLQRTRDGQPLPQAVREAFLLAVVRRQREIMDGIAHTIGPRFAEAIGGREVALGRIRQGARGYRPFNREYVFISEL